jgi:hypothetical protein
MSIIFINNIYQRQLVTCYQKAFFGEKMDNVDTPQKVTIVNKGFYA